MLTFLGLLGICVSKEIIKYGKNTRQGWCVRTKDCRTMLCQKLMKRGGGNHCLWHLPLDDGCVPLTCSGDTGWQGNESHMTYNSQSGQTTLCRAQTKKVVAYKFFSKLCHTCNDHVKRRNANESTPSPSHRFPKTWTESSKVMELNGILECAITDDRINGASFQ